MKIEFKLYIFKKKLQVIHDLFLISSNQLFQINWMHILSVFFQLYKNSLQLEKLAVTR